MKHDLSSCWPLDQHLLQLYTLAVCERRWEVAEYLLCALEALVKSEPACGATLEQAYLCIGDDDEPLNA